MIFSKNRTTYRILSFYCYFIVAGFMACNNKDKVILHDNILSFSTFPEETNITFNDLIEYKEGIPRTLQLVDSTLIIFNFGKNVKSFLYNYNLKNNKFSTGYLNKGRGPGEAYGGACTGITNKKLWVYDVTLKKIFLIDKSIALNDKCEDKVFSSYPLNDHFYKIALTDSFTFWGCGMFNTPYKIQKKDFSGKELDKFGEFKYIPKEMPIDALKDAYHSFFYIKPSGDKIALSYLYTDIVEIYDTKEPYTNIAVQGPSLVDLNFNVARIESENYNYMEKNKDIRKTFLAGATTDEYIYLAYSGLSYAERNDMNYCRFVFIYDWEGNPVKKLNLDRRIIGIAVSQDNKTIYSFDADTGFIIKADII
ncbi:MAG: hypothetical protein CR996_00860 [Draconibacterium sp.]|nr:MAG: hypothetical protein CR996_00860 [Draconibacterium sp.]